MFNVSELVRAAGLGSVKAAAEIAGKHDSDCDDDKKDKKKEEKEDGEGHERKEARDNALRIAQVCTKVAAALKMGSDGQPAALSSESVTGPNLSNVAQGTHAQKHLKPLPSGEMPTTDVSDPAPITGKTAQLRSPFRKQGSGQPTAMDVADAPHVQAAASSGPPEIGSNERLKRLPSSAVQAHNRNEADKHVGFGSAHQDAAVHTAFQGTMDNKTASAKALFRKLKEQVG